MCRTVPTKARAFTITELIIVLVIVICVVAIALPVLVSVRHHAAITLCESNLRQIGIEIELYRSDNHRAFPLATLMPAPFNSPSQAVQAPLYASLKQYISQDNGIYRSPGDYGQVFDRCAALSPLHLGISYAYFLFPQYSGTTRLAWDWMGDSLHGLVTPFHPNGGVHELNRDGSIVYLEHKSST